MEAAPGAGALPLVRTLGVHAADNDELGLIGHQLEVPAQLSEGHALIGDDARVALAVCRNDHLGDGAGPALCRRQLRAHALALAEADDVGADHSSTPGRSSSASIASCAISNGKTASVTQAMMVARVRMRKAIMSAMNSCAGPP